MQRRMLGVRRVLTDALGHFNYDDGWAMASHLAISALMALFPFLIFVTTLAGILGADALTGAVVTLVFETWPEQIAAPIAAEVENVLTVPRSGALTLSLLLAAIFASNGVEALRVALNRAYRVTETRSFLFLRAQSLLFVLVATICFLGVSFLIVLAPLIAGFSERHIPWLTPHVAITAMWRYSVATILIVVALATIHLWLPAGKRRLRHIYPGIVITLAAWLTGSLLFAYYIDRFSTYAATYAGLASIMIAIVFLYILSAIFILGAEFNAAIRRYRDERARVVDG